MTHHDTPSRTRLLLAARKLFSENGYESTSTASIARMAGTSESQLIKHFGGKAGLLDAIFVDGWNSLTGFMQQRLPLSMTPIERLRAIPRLMFEALQADQELRQLLLLEGQADPERRPAGHAHGRLPGICQTRGQYPRRDAPRGTIKK